MNVGRSIYETAGNFCASDNGEKGGKRKKAGLPTWKIRRKPRFYSQKTSNLPFLGKGIYEKSL